MDVAFAEKVAKQKNLVVLTKALEKRFSKSLCENFMPIAIIIFAMLGFCN